MKTVSRPWKCRARGPVLPPAAGSQAGAAPEERNCPETGTLSKKLTLIPG